PDVVVSMSTGVSVMRNVSSPGTINTGSFAARLDVATGNAYSAALGDLDGDGKLDVAVGKFGENTLSLLRDKSTPGTLNAGSFAPKVDFPTGASPSTVALADLDGDGKPDVVVGNAVGNTVSVYRNTSSAGSFSTNSLAARVDLEAGADPGNLVV